MTIEFRRCENVYCRSIIYPHHLAWKNNSKYCHKDCRNEYLSLKHVINGGDKEMVLKKEQDKELRKLESSYYPCNWDKSIILILD